MIFEIEVPAAHADVLASLARRARELSTKATS
jgi:hypothetical protein